MKKILGSLLILVTFIYANIVDLKVDKSEFYPGDSVNITISAQGNNVKIPNLKTIGGFNVVGIANSTQTNIINSKVTNIVSKTFTIIPTKSFTIQPIEVEVDGKIYKTPQKEVKLLNNPPQNSAQNGDFIFKLKANKTHLKVGESTILKIILKKKIDIDVNRILLDEIKNDNFWIKKISDGEKYINGDYEVYVYKYQITPQKSGTFKIGPLMAKIGFLQKEDFGDLGAFNDPFFEQFFQTIKYKKIWSNSLTFQVDPLPQNVEIFGSYEIFATVDKKSVKANEPVNLTIKILGEGNIEDIKKFNINIPQAVVYADEPKIKTYIKDGKNYGEFSQKIAIISDKSYTIPPIEFKYFDKIKNQVVTKKTKPIKIKVINNSFATQNKQKIDLEVSKKINPISSSTHKKTLPTNTNQENKYLKYIYLIIGIILGILGVLGYKKIFLLSTKKEKSSLEKKIKKAKNNKELYKILLPYANNHEIKSILEKLEQNIYHNKNNQIDKEEIIEILEEQELIFDPKTKSQK